MVYPHEIVIPPVCNENDKFMHIMHITNVRTDKSWYIKKGDVVAFARPEADMVQYMDVLGPEHEIKQQLQVRPRNWIPKSANITPIEVNETFMCIESTIDSEDSLLTLIDLHMRRKVIKENSENSLKSRETDTRDRQVLESMTSKSYFKKENIQKQGENEGNLRKL